MSVIKVSTNATSAKFCSTSKRRRTRTYQCNGETSLGTRLERQRSSTLMQRVHREPLQPRDLNGLLVIAMHHAGSLAQNLDRTRPGTTRAQNIRIEDRASRTGKITAGDLLDEPRHINMSRTSRGTRRIKTVEATICLRHRSLPVKWRVQIAEAFHHLRMRRHMFTKRRSLTHQYSIASSRSDKSRRKIKPTTVASWKTTRILLVMPPDSALEVTIMHYRSKSGRPVKEMPLRTRKLTLAFLRAQPVHS